MRVQPSYKFRRSNGRARRQIGYCSPSRVADHHLYRLYHFRGLPGSGNFDLPIISRTKGNYSLPNLTLIAKHESFGRIDRTSTKRFLPFCYSRIEQPSTRICACAC